MKYKVLAFIPFLVIALVVVTLYTFRAEIREWSYPHLDISDVKAVSSQEKGKICDFTGTVKTINETEDRYVGTIEEDATITFGIDKTIGEVRVGSKLHRCLILE